MFLGWRSHLPLLVLTHMSGGYQAGVEGGGGLPGLPARLLPLLSRHGLTWPPCLPAVLQHSHCPVTTLHLHSSYTEPDWRAAVRCGRGAGSSGGAGAVAAHNSHHCQTLQRGKACSVQCCCRAAGQTADTAVHTVYTAVLAVRFTLTAVARHALLVRQSRPPAPSHYIAELPCIAPKPQKRHCSVGSIY